MNKIHEASPVNRYRRLYWNYLWNHPVHAPTPSRALGDASDALTWFYVCMFYFVICAFFSTCLQTDNLISGSRSTVPFSKTECEDLSRVVEELSRQWFNAVDSATKILSLAEVPRNDKSISKTIFLAWLLREVYSFRDAECWGQYTQRESQILKKRQQLVQPSYQLPPVALLVLNFIVNILFFGIPHTYRAHVKVSFTTS